MKTPELKPCPFCGCNKRKLIIAKDFSGRYRVEHFCEFTILQRKWCETEQQAVDTWNRRIEDENA